MSHVLRKTQSGSEANFKIGMDHIYIVYVLFKTFNVSFLKKKKDKSIIEKLNC